MSRRFIISAIAICLSIHVFSQSIGTSKVNDGPYIFIEDGQLLLKSVVDGMVITKELASDAYDTTFSVQPYHYSDVAKIAALSDIHGQYDLAVKILQNNGIIDTAGNWSFGEGHLVVVGDIFDRGPKVTETLWLIYHLEKQAKEVGGAVHFLLGNHEYMVLHKDLRYLHSKYPVVSDLLNVDYDDLFGPSTVLGRWLRSKHTMLKINEHIFVHGGISKEFIAQAGVDISAINEAMRSSIDRNRMEMDSTGFYDIYHGINGPVWYRGYFYDPIPEQTVNSILKDMDTKHIIVGHCSNKEVVSRYRHKVFGVDSSIKLGATGEILLLFDGKYYRGLMSGKRIKLRRN